MVAGTRARTKGMRCYSEQFAPTAEGEALCSACRAAVGLAPYRTMIDDGRRGSPVRTGTDDVVLGGGTHRRDRHVHRAARGPDLVLPALLLRRGTCGSCTCDRSAAAMSLSRVAGPVPTVRRSQGRGRPLDGLGCRLAHTGSQPVVGRGANAVGGRSDVMAGSAVASSSGAPVPAQDCPMWTDALGRRLRRGERRAAARRPDVRSRRGTGARWTEIRQAGRYRHASRPSQTTISTAAGPRKPWGRRWPTKV